MNGTWSVFMKAKQVSNPSDVDIIFELCDEESIPAVLSQSQTGELLLTQARRRSIPNFPVCLHLYFMEEHAFS
jgi:hypothetical protein